MGAAILVIRAVFVEHLPSTLIGRLTPQLPQGMVRIYARGVLDGPMFHVTRMLKCQFTPGEAPFEFASGCASEFLDTRCKCSFPSLSEYARNNARKPSTAVAQLAFSFFLYLVAKNSFRQVVTSRLPPGEALSQVVLASALQSSPLSQ